MRFVFSAAMVCGVMISPALAGFIVTVEEIGDDVVVSGAGSLDLSLWGPPGPGLNSSPPTIGAIELNAQPIGTVLDRYNEQPFSFSGPANIGSGGSLIPASSLSGDPLLFIWIFGGSSMHVPQGYSFGAPLSFEMAFENHTVGSLGLPVGDYTWMWETADGPSDFFTINVLPAPGFPALLGLAWLAAARRHR